MHNHTMRKMTNKEKREALRKTIVELCGGCNIQDGKDGEGWPCGTCFMYLLTSIGLDSEAVAYAEKNDEHDRHNEVWRAILQIRDAKLK